MVKKENSPISKNTLYGAECDAIFCSQVGALVLGGGYPITGPLGREKVLSPLQAPIS